MFQNVCDTEWLIVDIRHPPSKSRTYIENAALAQYCPRPGHSCKKYDFLPVGNFLFMSEFGSIEGDSGHYLIHCHPSLEMTPVLMTQRAAEKYTFYFYSRFLTAVCPHMTPSQTFLIFFSLNAQKETFPQHGQTFVSTECSESRHNTPRKPPSPPKNVSIAQISVKAPYLFHFLLICLKQAAASAVDV